MEDLFPVNLRSFPCLPRAFSSPAGSYDPAEGRCLCSLALNFSLLLKSSSFSLSFFGSPGVDSTSAVLLISDNSLAFLSDIEMILEDLSHDIVLSSLLRLDAKASEDFFETNLLLLFFV